MGIQANPEQSIRKSSISIILPTRGRVESGKL